MKITKEEKSLYNFLNVFYAIFANSEYRNTIVGRGNKCYFFTNGYIGIFEDKDRDTMVGGNYDFKNSFYELKQVPSKSFLLDEVIIDDNVFDESVEKSIQLAEEFKKCNNFKLEYEKSYEYKISKIAEETGIWLKDTDIKYLDRFKKAEIFQLEDSVIVKSFGLTDEDCSNVTTVLVFVGEVHPNIDDSTQQKMNVDEQTLIEHKEQMLIEGGKEMLLESTEEQETVDIEKTMNDDIYPPEMEEESFDDSEDLLEPKDEVYF